MTEVYREGFGGYPQYDENGGAVPAAPAAYPPAGWTLTAVTASGQTDEPSTRDFWYYVRSTPGRLRQRLVGVEPSPAARSTTTSATCTTALANCAGDNRVNTSDVSLPRRATTASRLPLNGPLECLDVGPTTDLGRRTRGPTHRQQDQLRGPDPVRDQLRNGVGAAGEGAAGGGGRQRAAAARADARRPRARPSRSRSSCRAPATSRASPRSSATTRTWSSSSASKPARCWPRRPRRAWC